MALGLDQLGLAIRRVDSNLQSPAYQQRLPYVPRRTGFSADPNLLTLLVEPLYGKYPNVGVRELVQNAADAVRELHAWCDARGKSAGTLDLPKQDADVLVEFIKQADERWFLRVREKASAWRPIPSTITFFEPERRSAVARSGQRNSSTRVVTHG